jgi:hypothetical protein
MSFLFLFAAIATSGCASILNPGPDKVVFKSNPSGATVNLDGIDVGRTPCTVSINRTAFLVKMRLPGYKEGAAPIMYRTNQAMWADLVFFPILFGDGAVLAMGIDMAAHNDRVAVPEVQVDLRKTN